MEFVRKAEKLVIRSGNRIGLFLDLHSKFLVAIFGYGFIGKGEHFSCTKKFAKNFFVQGKCFPFKLENIFLARVDVENVRHHN